MTTGSKSVNLLQASTRIWTHYDHLEGGNDFSIPNGPTSVGSLYLKTWNGGDAATLPRNPPGKKRFYTTMVNGKRVTRSFREKTKRRATRRNPNPYYMESILEYRPSAIIEYRGYDASTFTHERTDIYTQVPACEQAYTTWPLAPVPNFGDNDQIKLINKLGEAIKGNDFNLSVMLGESHQTLKMIGDTAITVAKSLRAVRKGDVATALNLLFKGKEIGLWKPKAISGAKRSQAIETYNRQLKSYVKGSVKNTNQAIASQWLQLQYGWIPLLSDMKAGAELLSHQLNVPFRQRYSARVKVSESIKGDQATHPYEFYWFAKVVSSNSRQIIAYMSEEPSVASLTGMLDPELVAWELVPLSFVADWVIPIGAYLEARALVGRLVGEFVTTDFIKQECSGPVGTVNNLLVSPGKKFDVTVVEGGSASFYKRVVMQRSVSNSLSVPKPSVKSFKKAASWQHCANGLALLTQAASGTKVRF